jgi:nucleolar protein 15
MQPKSEEQKEGIKTRLVKRDEAKRERLRNLGIDYDFEGYSKKELPSTEEVKAIEVAKKLEKEVKKDAVVAASPAKKAKKGETSKANKKAKKA